MNTITWTSSRNNYKKMTFTRNDETKQHHFQVDLRDTKLTGLTNIYDIFNLHFEERQTKFVEVLFSGGMDSEITLRSCLRNNIPVRAITLRLFSGDILINMNDLYWAEKFCRENNVTQKLVDLDIKTFYDNGKFIDYIKPYLITSPHVAHHFWLFEQCTGFPVIGGDYSWPWGDPARLSPHRHSYTMYDMFLSDRGIHGIGNMINHSMDANLLFMKAHREVYNDELHNPSDIYKMAALKKAVFDKVGFTEMQPRFRAYGFENTPVRTYRTDLLKEFGHTSHTITWGDQIGNALNTDIRSNVNF